MQKLFQDFLDAVKKGDRVLLTLCLLTTAFGIVEIASATSYMGPTRFVLVQLVAAVLGILLFFIISAIDLSFFNEHRRELFIFNCVLLFLLIPFGVVHGGNKSWLDFPFLPIEIQPAEVCKITFILILASVMASHQNQLSKVSSVMHMAMHLIALVGLNMAISEDAGVSLIFVFIFIGMTFAGGVSTFWFALGGGAVAAAFPILWNYIMDQYQRDRILVLFDKTIDPYAVDEYYHTNQSLLSLTGGGLSGQGLFNGDRTSSGLLYAQHTDYIFSSIGEELGFLGCIAIIALELAIIARCIYVGTQAPDFSRKLVCYGASASLIFQVTINVGMCIGLVPVIGITLPFVSYGGSSILTCYAMLGLVSGVYARPSPGKQGLYIQPPR